MQSPRRSYGLHVYRLRHTQLGAWPAPRRLGAQRATHTGRSGVILHATYIGAQWPRRRSHFQQRPFAASLTPAGRTLALPSQDRRTARARRRHAPKLCAIGSTGRPQPHPLRSLANDNPHPMEAPPCPQPWH